MSQGLKNCSESRLINKKLLSDEVTYGTNIKNYEMKESIIYTFLIKSNDRVRTSVILFRYLYMLKKRPFSFLLFPFSFFFSYVKDTTSLYFDSINFHYLIKELLILFFLTKKSTY